MRAGAALKTGATKADWTAVTIEGFLHKSVIVAKKDALTVHASSGAALRASADPSARDHRGHRRWRNRWTSFRLNGEWYPGEARWVGADARSQDGGREGAAAGGRRASARPRARRQSQKVQPQRVRRAAPPRTPPRRCPATQRRRARDAPLAVG